MTERSDKRNREREQGWSEEDRISPPGQASAVSQRGRRGLGEFEVGGLDQAPETLAVMAGGNTGGAVQFKQQGDAATAPAGRRVRRRRGDGQSLGAGTSAVSTRGRAGLGGFRVGGHESAPPTAASIDTSHALQFRGSPAHKDAAEDAEETRRVAREGLTGGGKLPHAERIQEAFGRHDVSGVRAHIGGAAAEANKAMGSVAYATGNDIAFGGSPDLHTAAHEAAHVVQQRAGVSLTGGVGQAGDVYERHADAVADAVVGGRSAEGLLDQHSGVGGASAVQRKSEDLTAERTGMDAKARIIKFEGRLPYLEVDGPDGDLRLGMHARAAYPVLVLNFYGQDGNVQIDWFNLAGGVRRKTNYEEFMARGQTFHQLPGAKSGADHAKQAVVMDPRQRPAWAQLAQHISAAECYSLRNEPDEVIADRMLKKYEKLGKKTDSKSKDNTKNVFAPVAYRTMVNRVALRNMALAKAHIAKTIADPAALGAVVEEQALKLGRRTELKERTAAAGSAASAAGTAVTDEQNRQAERYPQAGNVTSDNRPLTAGVAEAPSPADTEKLATLQTAQQGADARHQEVASNERTELAATRRDDHVYAVLLANGGKADRAGVTAALSTISKNIDIAVAGIKKGSIRLYQMDLAQTGAEKALGKDSPVAMSGKHAAVKASKERDFGGMGAVLIDIMMSIIGGPVGWLYGVASAASGVEKSYKQQRVLHAAANSRTKGSGPVSQGVVDEAKAKFVVSLVTFVASQGKSLCGALGGKAATPAPDVWGQLFKGVKAPADGSSHLKQIQRTAFELLKDAEMRSKLFGDLNTARKLMSSIKGPSGKDAPKTWLKELQGRVDTMLASLMKLKKQTPEVQTTAGYATLQDHAYKLRLTIAQSRSLTD